MAVKPSSPAINISEIDKTAIVPAVGSSGGGFVGNFRWGPVHQRTLIADETGLVSTFAAPDDANSVDFHSAAYFLKYSQTLQVVRENNGGSNAHSALVPLTSDSCTVNNLSHWTNTVSSSVGEGGSKLSTGTWIAKYPGELGNALTVSFCPADSAFDHFNKQTDGSGHVNGWAYAGQFDGKPGTSAYALANGGTNDEVHVAVIDRTGAISGTPGSVLEKFEYLSVAKGATTSDNSPNYISDVLNGQSQYIWNGYFGDDSAFGSSYSNVGATWGSATNVASPVEYGVGDGTALPDAVRSVNLGSGDESAALGNTEFGLGYDLFEDKLQTEIDFLIAPQHGSAGDGATVVNDLVSIAEARKDCVVVTSVDKTGIVGKTDAQATTAAVTFANSLTKSSYLILDNNFIKVFDKYNDKYINLPAASSTAGLMAATDVIADPWYSPAGQRRGNYRGITDILTNPNQTQRDSLYKAGVNPIANIPGTGLILYGDKTLLGRPSAFDRINVRRLFIAIEKSIGEAAKSVMFEFNDEFTRAEFVNIVEPFLRRVKGRRGITDFRVVCDETNNNQEVVDNNQFVASIFVKPARSINFVQLNFVAVRTGVDFEEVVGSVGA
tara:strand:- start:19207 stop:21033 length:1827 start_codon:yes stop_codon:yes gene_type:complete